ncbi:MAG: hypothetical protein WA055_05335 [Candidatus Moraniibacteriota bacterium]
MRWQELSYTSKGAIVGGLIGLTGSILRPFFWSMNNDPFFVFGIIGMILRIFGVGGCSWKSSFCSVGDFFGYIITIIIFILIFTLIGFMVGKIKSKK